MLTSGQISAMTSQFQQQAMMQSQAAAMVSQNAGYGGGSSTMGEQITGTMVNRGAAIGAPLAMGGMALAGVDPFSMGFRGASFGARHGMGMLGSVGMGALGATGVGVGLMGAQYVGGQMMEGMGQQQMLQGALGQSFRFQNQFGGTGFTSTEMGSIGSMFRGMSQQRGPGGELTSFNELTQLAANMGRMGMSQNISNVREFQTKFKEMLSTVKEVATAFSTSLEEAQQVVVGMRQSGVFRNQGQVAQEIRGHALAGGLAQSEVTGMMRVGSQISRMIGGRGQAGAIGGMRAIGNVGAALQTGTLSEEDIYNATGMTGAEGRRAFATTMLQGEASFLKGGLGRRMVAALGGAGGSVNQEAIDEFMMGGGFGTGRTMSLAHQNLSKMGRADFIRNEGRIRGEIMRQTGGLGHVMAMRGWLEQRGLGMDDDRSLIFMQRRLGMGTDEAEQMLRMTRDLPLLMRQRERAVGDADYRSEVQTMRSRTGISGVKKKLEDAKNSIQGTVRQWGADLFETVSDNVEQMINSITGDVHQYIAHDVEALSHNIFKGGVAGEVALGRIGIGSRAAKTHGFDVAGARQRAFGGSRSLGAAAAMERAGDFKRLEEAGFRISSRTDAGIRQELKHMRGVTQGFHLGFGAQGGQYKDIGRRLKDELLSAAASGRISGAGMNRLASFEEYLSGSKDPEMQSIAMEMAGATDEQKARIMGDMMRSAGLGGTESSLMGGRDVEALFDQRGFLSAGAQHEAIGNAMMEGRGVRGGVVGAQKKAGETSAWSVAQAVERSVLGSVSSSFFSPTKFLKGQVDAHTDSIELSSRQMREIGSVAGQKDTLLRTRRILGADSQDRSEAVRELQQQQTQILQQAGGEVSKIKEGRAQYEVNQAQIAMGKLIASAPGGDISKMSDEARQRVATESGYANADVMMNAASVLVGAAKFEEDSARRQVMERAGRRGEGRLKAAQGDAGFLTGAGGDELRGSVQERLSKIGSKKGGISAGERLALHMGKSLQGQASLRDSAFSGDLSLQTIAIQGATEQEVLAMDQLAGMSVAEKRQFAQATAGVAGLEGARGAAVRQAGLQQRLSRYGSRGAVGRGIGVARELGVDLSQQDRASLAGMSHVEQSQFLAGKLGSGLEATQMQELQKRIQSTLESSAKGKFGDAARGLDDLQGDDLIKDARQKQQDARSKEQDPSYRVLTGIKEALSNTLKVSVIGQVQTVDGGDGAPEEPKKK